MMGRDGSLIAESVKRATSYLGVFLSAFSFAMVDHGSVILSLHFAFPNIAYE